MIKVERKLPENFESEHLPYFSHHLKITLPEIGFELVEGVYALFDNGIVVSNFRVLRQSLLYDTRQADNGGWISLFKTFVRAFFSLQVSLQRKNFTPVSIINEWSHGYFHWVTEALPKLLILLQAGMNPVVLLPQEFQSAYLLRSLELLGVKHQPFSGKILFGRKLILPKRLAPFSGHYNPIVMRQLAKRLKACLPLDQDTGDRIYISRRNAGRRKVKNEDQVIELVLQFGFRIVETEKLTLDEQIAVMHKAEMLVSVHGAGLTNMLFCKPGTRVLELSFEKESMDKCYFNLANAMNLKYYYQFCKPVSLPADYHSSDLVVDTEELRKNLFKLTQNDRV